MTVIIFTIFSFGFFETVFHYNSKHLEACQIHSTARGILNILLDIGNVVKHSPSCLRQCIKCAHRTIYFSINLLAFYREFRLNNYATHYLSQISINLPAFYRECRSLIGYPTDYLSLISIKSTSVLSRMPFSDWLRYSLSICDR